MIRGISRMMTDLNFLWRWLAGAIGNRIMISDFVLWYIDIGSELKLYTTSWNSNSNTVLDKSCLCLIAEYIFFMIEEDRGRYFSDCAYFRCHGSKLFLCIPEHNDTFWYKSLSCINDLNCFPPSSIIADMVTYASFGKSEDGSLILQIISFLAWTDLLVKLHTSFLCPCRIY